MASAVDDMRAAVEDSPSGRAARSQAARSRRPRDEQAHRPGDRPPGQSHRDRRSLSQGPTQGGCDGTGPRSASLGLLIDVDPTMRHLTGPLVRSHGLELVQARSGIAAFELLEQVPERVSPRPREPRHARSAPARSSWRRSGCSGRISRRSASPALSGWRSSDGSGRCLAKPVRADELEGSDQRGAGGDPVETAGHRAASRRRSRAPRRAFARSGSLFEAARELARGMTDGSR